MLLLLLTQFPGWLSVVWVDCVTILIRVDMHNLSVMTEILLPWYSFHFHLLNFMSCLHGYKSGHTTWFSQWTIYILYNSILMVSLLCPHNICLPCLLLLCQEINNSYPQYALSKFQSVCACMIVVFWIGYSFFFHFWKLLKFKINLNYSVCLLSQMLIRKATQLSVTFIATSVLIISNQSSLVWR